MAFTPFGLKSERSRPAKRPKVTPLAEFAEASTDLPAEDDKTEEEKLADSEKLQEEGSLKAEAAKHSEAIRLFDKALGLTPTRAVLHELKAQVFLEIDHHWDAICSATTATEYAPAWPEAHLTLARAQLSFGEPEAALTHMEKVLSLEPQHAGAIAEIDTVRMLVLKRRKDPDASRERLRVL